MVMCSVVKEHIMVECRYSCPSGSLKDGTTEGTVFCLLPKPYVRPGRQWRDSNPRQKGPYSIFHLFTTTPSLAFHHHLKVAITSTLISSSLRLRENRLRFLNCPCNCCICRGMFDSKDLT
ncbi:hypothetical protein PoB_002623100 [Plakobranchus ocellatus]|uniref:Uncharacterized protein n=1 Tax=Plakobranchus ocellatus TaxID=259542 RepID=A0AAV3ZKS8_9GAST|nr:hypothetical protein PoB_002623100 [Plakobranchus ocellatus]